MKEIDPILSRQGICLDRVRQLRNGLRQISLCNSILDANPGHYDVEDSREGHEGEIVRIDRPLVHAIEGGVNGVYRELVDYGEKVAADQIIWDYKHDKPMDDGS